MRKMLLKIEELPPSVNINKLVIAESFLGEDFLSDIVDKEFAERERLKQERIELVNSHMKLLIEAGLIVGHCEPQGSYFVDKFRKTQSIDYICYGVCLTWQGYDFLDTIRKDSTWKDICNMLRSKGVELTIDAVFFVAKKLTSQYLGLEV